MWRLCGSITSNTGSDANGDSHICADCDRHFRQNRGNNQHLISCSNSSSLIFKHHWKEIKTLQMIEHLRIQILRFYIFQLHHCNINGAVIKIFCLRKIYLSLRINSILEEKPIFITIWTSGKELHRWNFQINDRLDTRIATKKYGV